MLGRRLFLCHLGGSFTILGAGCGTVFHHERIGQPHGRDIDWEVAALNGLGLALFFVPGVVAFVVDFYNGTIYLPQSTTRVASLRVAESPPSDSITRNAIDSTRNLMMGIAEGSAATLRRIFVNDEDRISPESIETQVSEEIGQPVSLSNDSARVSKLATLDQYSHQCRQHDRDPHYGIAPAKFFAVVENSA